jgi:hypothetical protein
MLTEKRIFDAISSIGFYRVMNNRSGSPIVWQSYFFKEIFPYEGVNILPKEIIKLLREDSESIIDLSDRSLDDIPY